MTKNRTNSLTRPQDLPNWSDLSEEEKIDAVAAWVLATYKIAFEELAK